MSIRILDKSLTQKIAAGEVVERPASVIKELIENSIDAGATNITVEIENGGISYLRVTDNGCGMSEEDSLLCFKQHATSKIYNEDDLY
ncbi:MAG: ATP-binding protein, partial [Lachnospiraceae bacterium]|nr:ATP-binding protein [Lachnospiraceae bacterium]